MADSAGGDRGVSPGRDKPSSGLASPLFRSRKPFGLPGAPILAAPAAHVSPTEFVAERLYGNRMERMSLDIIVCVKRVPDTETRVRFSDGARMIDSEGVKYIVSPYDEFALEAAFRTTEAGGEG